MFILTKTTAQNVNSFMIVDAVGSTFEINPTNCSIIQLDSCFGGFISSLTLINNTVYFTDGVALYRYTYNTYTSCEYLGLLVPLNSLFSINSLTSSLNGIIYAAGGNTIISYDTNTSIFANVGELPVQWQSAGDLVFLNNKLYLSTTIFELVEINLSNLSTSQSILTFPNTTSIYGLATVGVNCAENLLFALNITGFNTTTILPINLANSIAGNSICTIPFIALDAASLSENGSSNLIIPTFTITNNFCKNAVVPVLPSTSNNGIAGTWSPSIIDNQASNNYVFTPTAGQCASAFTLNVTITNPITPTFTIGNTFCKKCNCANFTFNF